MPLTTSTQLPFPISDDTTASATYRAALSFTAPSGQFLELRGSGSSISTITKVVVELGASDTLTVTKQSAASTGGTSSDATNVPLDATNAAANMVVRTYTAASTAGAAVGDIAVLIGTSFIFDFGSGSKQGVMLNAATETLGFDLATGTTVTGYVEWTEA